jgi:hypothetical protein
MRQDRSRTSGSSGIQRVLIDATFIAAMTLATVATLSMAACADEFDRIEGAYLFDLTRRADAHGQTSVSLRAR